MNNLELYCAYNVSPKSSEDARKFALTQEQIFILQDQELSVHFAENHRHFTTFSSELLRSDISIKEFFGKYIAYGKDNEIMMINYSTGKIENYPIAYDQVAWSDASHFAVIEGSEVSTYLIHDIDVDCDLIKAGSCSIYEDKPKHQYINLGWGSESTQFRGKRKKPEEVEEVKYNIDKSPPKIIWSHSNDMFLINMFHPTLQKRIYSIFSSECQLLYRGPDVEGMQAAVTWKPPHSLIAVPVSVGDILELHFYEKIGPIRDKFTLRDSLPIVDMQWSNDGLLIGIAQEDSDLSILSIYMSQLGRWYLKQYFKFLKPQKIQQFHVSQMLYNDKLYQLCLMTNCDFVTYYFKLGQTPTPILSGEVGKTGCAVINGNLLEIYLYSEQIIPPGMPEIQLDIKNPLNVVQFHPYNSEVLCVDSESMLRILNYSSNTEIYKFDLRNGKFLYPNIFWKLDNSIEIYETHLEDNTTNIRHIELNSNTSNIERIGMPLCYRKFTNNKEYVISGYKSCVVISHLLSLDKSVLTATYDSISMHSEAVIIDGNWYLFSILESGKFYVNKLLISHNVSSFVIHGEYLHYTNNLRRKMYTIILNKSSIDKIFKRVINFKNAIGRSIEINAVLVTGIPKQPDILLYMPRGNLENIRVELIMLRVIEDIISSPLQWSKAHDLIRMQKMDSNILVDLNYNRFVNSIEDFIECIKSPSILCQFLEELSPKCTSCEVFFQFYPEKRIGEVKNKVQIICNKIINAIKYSKIYCEYLLTVVCGCIAGFGNNGLIMAFDNMVTVLAAHKNPKANNSVVNCINYLKNKYTDKELFTASLGTSNLQFANIVADALKKDPKEYKPILAKFSTFQGLELRFELNKYLENYSIALAWLFRMQNNSKLFEFIEENSLETKAIEDVPLTMVDLHKNIQEKHCDFLLAKGLFLPSLIYSMKVKKYLEGFEAANKLVLPLEMFELLKFLETKDNGLSEVLEKLEANYMWNELIHYYKFVVKDYKKVIELFINSGQLKNAFDMGLEVNLPDYDLNYFNTEAALDVKMQLENLIKIEETFNNYKNRLEQVRATKLVTDLMDEEDMETLYAESSVASTKGSSKHSKQTARQKKRLEKKLTSLRPGGKFEEIALVRALHISICDIFKLTNKAQTLLEIAESVACETKQEIANFVQRTFNLQKDACAASETIWNKKDVRIKRGYYHLMGSEYILPPKDMDMSWSIELFT